MHPSDSHPGRNQRGERTNLRVRDLARRVDRDDEAGVARHVGVEQRIQRGRDVDREALLAQHLGEEHGGRFGRRRFLWVGVAIMLVGGIVTLPASVPIKIFGVAIFTFGFFGAHSIASSWVGRRAAGEKAQASALYLFFYYIGASVGGTSGGLFWSWLGWPGVIGLIAVFLVGAFAITLRLSKIPPVASLPTR
ncbi:MAG: MFS transporter [Ktedonobacterales bacterium]